MFSGSCPPGSSSAPSSGNTGIACGRSAALRYPVGIGWLLAEEDRRQAPASLLGDIGHLTGGLEHGQQLLARRLVVPGAIALDDGQQVVRGAFEVALTGQGSGEIEAGLMVVGVRGQRGFE